MTAQQRTPASYIDKRPLFSPIQAAIIGVLLSIVGFFTNATSSNTKEIKNLIVTDIEVNDTTYSYGNSLNAYCTLTDAHIDRWRLKNTGHSLGTTLARGTFRQHWSKAAPSTVSWSLGEIVYNSEPSAGEYIGWICTTAGSPGTWKEFGAIAQ